MVIYWICLCRIYRRISFVIEIQSLNTLQLLGSCPSWIPIFQSHDQGEEEAVLLGDRELPLEGRWLGIVTGVSVPTGHPPFSTGFSWAATADFSRGGPWFSVLLSEVNSLVYFSVLFSLHDFNSLSWYYSTQISPWPVLVGLYLATSKNLTYSKRLHRNYLAQIDMCSHLCGLSWLLIEIGQLKSLWAVQFLD